jgi:hypothetical protein
MPNIAVLITFVLTGNPSQDQLMQRGFMNPLDRPVRTSPTANTHGAVVSSISGARPSSSNCPLATVAGVGPGHHVSAGIGVAVMPLIQGDETDTEERPEGGSAARASPAAHFCHPGRV